MLRGEVLIRLGRNYVASVGLRLDVDAHVSDFCGPQYPHSLEESGDKFLLSDDKFNFVGKLGHSRHLGENFCNCVNLHLV